jgi:hypothetical protein
MQTLQVLVEWALNVPAFSSVFGLASESATSIILTLLSCVSPFTLIPDQPERISGTNELTGPVYDYGRRSMVARQAANAGHERLKSNRPSLVSASLQGPQS